MPEKLEKIPRLKTDNRWSFETTVFSNQLQLDTINNPDLPMTNLILWKVHLPQIKDILMEDPETVSGSSDPVAISFPVLYTKTLLFIHSRWSEVKWNCSVVSDSLHSPWMDCVLWGPSIHGILQARILERVAISFSRGSSWPRDRTWVSCIANRCFYGLSHQGIANSCQSQLSIPSLLQSFSPWQPQICSLCLWVFSVS